MFQFFNCMNISIRIIFPVEFSLLSLIIVTLLLIIFFGISLLIFVVILIISIKFTSSESCSSDSLPESDSSFSSIFASPASHCPSSSTVRPTSLQCHSILLWWSCIILSTVSCGRSLPCCFSKICHIPPQQQLTSHNLLDAEMQTKTIEVRNFLNLTREHHTTFIMLVLHGRSKRRCFFGVRGYREGLDQCLPS